MKTIGLIGGTGWVSTLEYYRLVNQATNRRLGGLEAARCILYSFNFGDLARLKAADPEQRGVCELVVAAARTLERSGAELLALCANTLHWFVPEVEAAVSLPLVHVAEAAAAAIRSAQLTTVGLLGTLPTMEKDFYRGRLAAQGLTTLVPDAADRAYLDAAILHELVREEFRPETRARFVEIIERLCARGAQGIVLGCTEIPLLVRPEDCRVPLFDTLGIHAEAIVEAALAG